MKKFLKIIATIISICIICCALSACTIINNNNHNDDGTNSDNNASDNDNGSSGNSGTVNGLPKITLTEGMTKEEIKTALSECKNYKMYCYPSSTEENYLIYHFVENGYSTTEYEDNTLQSVFSGFYEALHGYELRYNLDSDTNEGKYYFQVYNVDDEAHGYDVLESLYSDLENFDKAEVKDEKIIFQDYDDDDLYVISDFNNTVVNFEHYFPDYKSLEVGEGGTTIDWEYVKSLVQ